MTQLSLGDLSQFFQTRRQTVQVKNDIQRLTSELSSGKVADVARHVRGDLSTLADVERQLSLLGSYGVAINETRAAMDSTQVTLDAIRQTVDVTAESLLQLSGTFHPESFANAAADARHAFDTVIARLNGALGDRALFAGTNFSGPALASADVMLADIVPTLAGLTSAADVSTAVDAWFAHGGGFDSNGYLGAPTQATAALGPNGVSVTLPITAQDDAFRQALAGIVKAALPTAGVSLAPDEANALLSTAALTLYNATDELVATGAQVGHLQSRLEDILVQNQASVAGFEISRAALLGADPYETATALEDAQTQLEMLYAMTARLSRLSMVNYL